MKKETYEKKIGDILKLEQFEKLVYPRKNSKDWTRSEQDRINEALGELLGSGEIDKELYDKMKSSGGQPARLYGLAKVHKDIIPLRPVLSMPGSPYYNIATTVTKWLSVVPESKSNCTSKKIADQLKDIVLDEGEVLVSFDVVSLYTNVPVLEAIQEAADRLYCGEFETPPVSKETFVELLKLASTNVVMLTSDGYYVQKDGLAMGSPPAPLLANIWLSNREKHLKDDAKLFERYMDDIIRSIQLHLAAQKLEQINKIHKNLKFTMEIEEDGLIPFLDMLLRRIGLYLSSTWYCKPTDTGLVMNFHALSPKRYKRSVVSGFVHRIHRACSTWKDFHESLEKAKEVLEKNQYPPQFYNPILEETLTKIHNPNIETSTTSAKDTAEENQDEGEPQVNQVIALQYRGAETDKLVARLKNCGAPVQVVLTLRKLKTYLPSLKPQIPKMIKSNVVYKVTCPRCQACYVGKTFRHLCIRYGEERTRAAETVFKHMKKCGGAKQLKDEHIEVLSTVRGGNFRLKIMEALFIRELEPSINIRDEFNDHELVIKF